MQNQQILEDRIAELEMKIAFQEQLLDELNQALVQQQFDMDKINFNSAISPQIKRYATLLILPAKRKKHRLRIIKM